MVCLGFEPGLQDGRCRRIHWATAFLNNMKDSFLLKFNPKKGVMQDFFVLLLGYRVIANNSLLLQTERRNLLSVFDVPGIVSTREKMRSRLSRSRLESGMKNVLNVYPEISSYLISIWVTFTILLAALLTTAMVALIAKDSLNIEGWWRLLIHK